MRTQYPCSFCLGQFFICNYVPLMTFLNSLGIFIQGYESCFTLCPLEFWPLSHKYPIHHSVCLKFFFFLIFIYLAALGPIVVVYMIFSYDIWTLSCETQCVLRPGIEPGSSKLGAWSLGHWTTRELPQCTFLISSSYIWLDCSPVFIFQSLWFLQIFQFMYLCCVHSMIFCGHKSGASLVVQMVKNLSAVHETWVYIFVL